MNEILPGTTTKDGFVAQQAQASMHVNSEFVSNENDVQNEKHDEERI
jgi:hypothetical protein